MTEINNIKINNLNLNIDFAGYFKFGLREIYSLLEKRLKNSPIY